MSLLCVWLVCPIQVPDDPKTRATPPFSTLLQRMDAAATLSGHRDERPRVMALSMSADDRVLGDIRNSADEVGPGFPRQVCHHMNIVSHCS